MKKIVAFVFVVLMLVIGVVGCGGNKLNGTWVGEDGNEGVEAKFDNGNFEISLTQDFYSGPMQKGTYSLKANEIMQTRTHIYGGFLDIISSSNYDKSRWYTMEEIVSKGEGSLFNSSWMAEYSINGKILTFTSKDDEGEPYTETFTRKENQKDISKSPGKSSGSASALTGRWSLVEGSTRGNPEEIELLKDGTGIIDEMGITWKIENGRLYLINPLSAFSSIYNVSGSTLTLTKDDGTILKYKKK